MSKASKSVFALPLRGRDYMVSTDTRTPRSMRNKLIKIIRRAEILVD